MRNLACLAVLAPTLCLAQGFTIFTLPHNGLVPDNQSSRVSISRNGRYVTFISSGNNNPLGNSNQLYLSDRVTRVFEPISISLTNGPGDGFSYDSSVSDDGRFVAFTSEADNLAPDDVPSNIDSDIFVRDRLSQTTELINKGIGGAPANGVSGDVTISGDGRYVSYDSLASNLVPDDTNGTWDGFVFDRLTGTTQRVTLSETGAQAPFESERIRMTRDGTKVFFQNRAPLVAGDTNQSIDIFVRDLVANTTRRVSLSNTGEQAIFGALSPGISADGRFICFSSGSPNLVEGDTNALSDIFLRDDLLGTTVLVTVSSQGVQANAQTISQSRVSDDGRFVTFHSSASNLVPNDDNGRFDVFVRDVQNGTTRLLSRSAKGEIGNLSSLFPVISSNGRFLAFTSQATNLVNPHPPKGERNAVYGVDLSDSFAASTLQIVRGSVQNGNLQSLQSSNDAYLTLRPGITFTTQQAPIEIVVSATSPVVEPHTLEFWIEGRGSAPAISQSIEMFNFDSSAYEPVGTAQLTVTDSVVSIQIDENPGRFVAANGEVRTRLRYRATGPVFAYPWETRIDHVQWFVME